MCEKSLLWSPQNKADANWRHCLRSESDHNLFSRQSESYPKLRKISSALINNSASSRDGLSNSNWAIRAHPSPDPTYRNLSKNGVIEPILTCRRAMKFLPVQKRDSCTCGKFRTVDRIFVLVWSDQFVFDSGVNCIWKFQVQKFVGTSLGIPKVKKIGKTKIGVPKWNFV